MNQPKALRGINLGGWLVAERWMTPELFQGVRSDGEIALVRELGYTTARDRLIRHRSTFITERDFKWIKSAGFDFVRLPVGYWLFAEVDDFIDGERYLKLAFTWAQRHDLGIVLDFHGLQGSQNGQDHSGQVGKVRLYRDHNDLSALGTLEYMCKTYGGQPELIGIELINEPKVRWFLWRLLKYYDRAIPIADKYLRPEAKIIVSDAFKPLRMARALSRRGYSERVVLDIHLYQLFSRKDRKRNLSEHMDIVTRNWTGLLTRLNTYCPVMVGEWSAALPTETYLRDGLNEAEHASVYFAEQQQAFDRYVWAHSYWSYKVPGGGVWDYRMGIRHR